jgi:hypothetical protein
MDKNTCTNNISTHTGCTCPPKPLTTSRARTVYVSPGEPSMYGNCSQPRGSASWWAAKATCTPPVPLTHHPRLLLTRVTPTPPLRPSLNKQQLRSLCGHGDQRLMLSVEHAQCNSSSSSDCHPRSGTPLPTQGSAHQRQGSVHQASQMVNMDLVRSCESVCAPQPVRREACGLWEFELRP